MINIGEGCTFPDTLVTESIGIFAVKRAGKTTTAKRLVEQLQLAGQQVIVIDPKGDWYGIRYSRDGKGAGVPIVIVGGEYGDVPLEASAASVIARAAVTERVSMLIDASGLLASGDFESFMAAFLEGLYRLKQREEYRTPVMVVIDEADHVAPQQLDKHQKPMLRAAENLVRLGGQRGLGITLVTQRPASLNTNVRTQLGVLFLLRTTGTHDIKAIDDWIGRHGQERERRRVMESLASLPIGSGWVWAPGFPDEKGTFARVTVTPPAVFDTGRTPRPGERQHALPKTSTTRSRRARRRS